MTRTDLVKLTAARQEEPDAARSTASATGAAVRRHVLERAELSSRVAALYAAVRLVMVADDLDAARTQQAEGAVGQERLRVSRDLHDLLGQSLSAISLKGDLALRLLPFDPARAGSEIESLTGVARSALHGVIAIARDEHSVSLHGEIDAAGSARAGPCSHRRHPGRSA